jgi:hypothetical protein
MILAAIACLSHRHCAERSNDAIQGYRTWPRAAALDCFAALAMTVQGSNLE